MPATLLDSVLEILARRRFALAEAAAGATRAVELLKTSKEPSDARLAAFFMSNAKDCDETRATVEDLESKFAAVAAEGVDVGRAAASKPGDFRERVIAEIKRRRAFFEQRQSESLDKRAVEDGEALRYATLTDAMSGLLTFVETL